MRMRKIFKPSKIQKKVRGRVNMRISKIMCTPVNVGVRTYATYANCRNLMVL